MQTLRVVSALIGLLSVFLGYRLFCGTSDRKLTNFASGTLLALFGMGILVIDVRGFRDRAPSSNPDWQHKSAVHKPVNSEVHFI